MGWIRDKKLHIRGAGGKGASNAYVPVEDPTSLRSNAFAKVIDLVSEGEIEGLVSGYKSIYLDGVPVQNSAGEYNFSGCGFTMENGTQDQPPLRGFSSIESEVLVGRQVLFDTPVRRPILEPNLEAIRVTVEVPTLVKYEDNGDIKGTSVDYDIVVYSGYQDENNIGTQHLYMSDTIRGKTTSPYRKSRIVPLAMYGEGPWMVEVQRKTPDSIDSKLNNNISWYSYTGIVYEKLSYPMSAVIGLSVDSRYFNNIPTRGYDLKLLRVRVPDIYDPITRTYSGIWDGSFKIAWTDNPAWCFYDFVTNNRYGLSDKFFTEDLVDKWELLKVSKYCDELVPSGVLIDGIMQEEPRFTCNVYLQTREDAYSLLNQFTSIFRAAAFWDGSKLFVSQDAPKEPSALFTNANVQDGVFTYEGSGLKARHTTASVSWNDPSVFYKRQVEYVEDQESLLSLGYRPMEISAVGCTSRGQANRLGRWALATERYETQAVTFVTGGDAAGLYPGTIIQVQDEHRSGLRYSGRLIGASVSSISLDRNPKNIMVAGDKFSAYISMPNSGVHDNDNPVPTPTFMPAIEQVEAVYTGFGATYNIFPNLSQEPVANAVWVFEDINSSQTQLFKVMGIEEVSPLQYAVTGVEHEPDKYRSVDSDTVLEERPVAISSGQPATPRNLTATEEIFVSGVGVRSHVFLDWNVDSNATKYKIEVNKDSAGWEVLALENTSSSFTYTDAVVGSVYQFRVTAKNAFNRESAGYALVTILVDGKKDLPEDITEFTVVRGRETLTLNWVHTNDSDRLGYEIRRTTDKILDFRSEDELETAWNNNSNFILVDNLSGNGVIASKITANSFVTDLIEGGTYTYLIKSINTSGGESRVPRALTLSIASPKKVAGLACIQNRRRIELVWYANTEVGLIGYEVREGSSWASSVKVAEVTVTRYSFSYGSYNRNRTFWVKAIVSPGIYSEKAARADTEVLQITDYNAVYSYTANELNWDAGYYPSTHWKIDLDKTLVTLPNVTYSEYTFDISMAAKFRAQTTISANYTMQGVDKETWADATYTWTSTKALRTWDPEALTSLAELTFQIATKTGALDPNEIAVWEFTTDLNSYSSPTNPVILPNAGYNDVVIATGVSGRHYNNSLELGSITLSSTPDKSLSYSVVIPRTFTWGIWVNVVTEPDIQHQIIKLEHDNGEFLNVDYNSNNNYISLVGGYWFEGVLTYNLLSIETFDISNTTGVGAEELVFIGISQTEDTRSVYISNVSNTKAVFSSSNIPANSVGYTKIKVA